MNRIAKRSLLLLAATSLALTAACKDSAEAPGPPPAPPRATAKPASTEAPATEPSKAPAAAPGDPELGRADYQTLCASCHGATGAGDGPVAATLDPRPARHDDGSYMNALTDDYLFRVIKLGGAAVDKSPMMAPFGGSLSDQQIRNVVAFIRTLADPPYRPPARASN